MLDDALALHGAQAICVMVVLQLISVIGAAATGRLGLAVVSASIMTGGALAVAMTSASSGALSWFPMLLAGGSTGIAYGFFLRKALQVNLRKSD